MAELDHEARDRIMKVFLARYNERHGTDYDQFTDGPPGADVDYLCTGSKGETPLRIQHTRAWADPETEWRHPKDVENFVIRGLQHRLDEHEVVDRHVSICVDQLPARRVDKLRLIEDIWSAAEVGLQGKWSSPLLYRLVHFNRQDWNQLYQPIAPYVSNLEVLEQVPPLSAPARVGWSATGLSIDGVPDSLYRIEEALKKKEGRYGGKSTDLVLLIDFEVMPYFADELDRIRAALVSRPISFQAVWVCSQWQPMSADCVWPTTAISDVPGDAMSHPGE